MYEIVVVKAHYYPKGSRFGSTLELIDLLDNNFVPIIAGEKVYLTNGFDPEGTFEPIDTAERNKKWIANSPDDQWADDELLQTKQDFVSFEFTPITDFSPYSASGEPYMSAMLEWRNEYELYGDDILEIWKYIKDENKEHPHGGAHTWTALTLWNVNLDCHKDYEGFTDCDDEWSYMGILSTNKLPNALMDKELPAVSARR